MKTCLIFIIWLVLPLTAWRRPLVPCLQKAMRFPSAAMADGTILQSILKPTFYMSHGEITCR